MSEKILVHYGNIRVLLDALHEIKANNSCECIWDDAGENIETMCARCIAKDALKRFSGVENEAV